MFEFSWISLVKFGFHLILSVLDTHKLLGDQVFMTEHCHLHMEMACTVRVKHKKVHSCLDLWQL